MDGLANRVTIADTAMNFLVRRNACDGGNCWFLDVGMDYLYDIYDEWVAANDIPSEHRARSGRSRGERARAIPRAVMRALKHTKRGQELFDTSCYITYPGMAGGYCILAELRKEKRMTAGFNGECGK